MPVEYTPSGRIKRVQADSVLETKLVINEMLSKKQEYQHELRQLALSTSEMRGSFRTMSAGRRSAGNLSAGPPLPAALVRARLERTIRPVELKKLELERLISHIEQCIWQLDGYFAQIKETGVRQHDFHLHYQPIIDLNTNLIAGFEALVRWQRSQDDFSLPADFIPIAEETGIMAQIDRWVLRNACRQLHEWHEQFPAQGQLTVNVNVSNAHLMEDDAVEFLRDILHENALQGQHLRLEIMESAVVENMQAFNANIDRVRALGIQLNIDNFRNDNSLMANYEQLPFQALSIDRALIQTVDEGQLGRQRVADLIQLAHSRQMRVVAKGIENQGQLNQVRALASEYAQGYLFSRPVDSHAATALLASGQAW
jgi:EAL domain-containing protein (putative c-di-GMP-specific phosphodiesterase class I)